MYGINPEQVQLHINDLQREAERIQLARLARGETHPRFRQLGLMNMLSHWIGKRKTQRVETVQSRLITRGVALPR
jgi:hypothetical protein